MPFDPGEPCGLFGAGLDGVGALRAENAGRGSDVKRAGRAEVLQTASLGPGKARRGVAAVGKIVAHHFIGGIDRRGGRATNTGKSGCQILHATGLRPEEGVLQIRPGVGVTDNRASVML